MHSFKTRSYKKELLDSDDIPFKDIKQNMRELAVINKYLGGHAITIRGIKKLIHQCSGELHIVEVGCGGGDNLKAIQNWFKSHQLPVKLTGIDNNSHCVQFAQEKNPDISFVESDYRHVNFQHKPDIIFSSLFTHHFTDVEIIDMLQWMWNHTTRGFMINDLHRHPVAYASIRALTQIFSNSYLVKNDAPLSVQRSFRRKDWHSYFSKAGIPLSSCKWQWAFRWLVISLHNDH